MCQRAQLLTSERISRQCVRYGIIISKDPRYTPDRKSQGRTQNAAPLRSINKQVQNDIDSIPRHYLK